MPFLLRGYVEAKRASRSAEMRGALLCPGNVYVRDDEAMPCGNGALRCRRTDTARRAGHQCKFVRQQAFIHDLPFAQAFEIAT